MYVERVDSMLYLEAIRQMHVQTGKEIHRLDGHTVRIFSVACLLTAIGSLLRVAIRLSGVPTRGQPISQVATFTLSSDGYQIVSGSLDHTIRI
jgi:WD40 repeat protein